MSAAFDAFWKALETNKDLQMRLKGIASREDIANIAAEFGFVFSKNELDEDAMINEGYCLEWPRDSRETVKRVKLIAVLRKEVTELREKVDQIISALEGEGRIQPERRDYTYRG